MSLIPNIANKLSKLFKLWSGNVPESARQILNSGSSRIYYRLKYMDKSAIGVYNTNFDENITFLNFTNQFLDSNIKVPIIYEEKLDDDIYLIQDLGDVQLLSWLILDKTNHQFSDKALSIYKIVIRELVRIQIVAGRNFDYSKCYQFSEFDEQSIKFDLNYFKTNYANTLNLSFDKNKLNADFDLLAKYLLTADNNYFMFRDFQARNIILVNDFPFFIDYQGGRKGPLQYDLVSLLFQAKAEIPIQTRNMLLEYYISVARLFIPINKNNFIEYYFAFALIRVLQTLGAYGLRGLIEKKSHFIESIPLAIKNLVYLKDKIKILNKLPELKIIIDQITNAEINRNE
jgi:aminoglycoside/choline kinase family phosphotransferase